MAKTIALTEEQKAEMERLKESEHVRLARREQRLLYRQRQMLYTLRNLEKRGKELMDSGVTMENIEDLIAQTETAMSELGEE